MHFSLLAAPFVSLLILKSAHARIDSPPISSIGGVGRIDHSNKLPQWVQRRQILNPWPSFNPLDLTSSSSSSLTTTPSTSSSATASEPTITSSSSDNISITTIPSSLPSISPTSTSTPSADPSSSGSSSTPSTSLIPAVTSGSVPATSPSGVVTIDVAAQDGIEESGGNVTYTMIESKIYQETSLGNITTHCLTSIRNPSEQFCRTLLNGASMDSSPVAIMAIPSVGEISSAFIPSTISSSPSTSSASSSPAISTSTSITSSSTTDSVSPSTLASSVSAGVSSTLIFGSWTFASPTAAPIPLSSDSAILSSSSATASAVPTEISTSSEISSSSDIPSSSESIVESTSSMLESTTLAPVETPTPSESPVTSASATTVETITISTTPDSSLSSSASALFSTSTSVASVALAAAGAGSTETNNESDRYPGQKIAVLPIGLGVFGGLVGIALCIVGYMLYQRRLYRGQFMRRKAEEKALASRGAGMGYGGA